MSIAMYIISSIFRLLTVTHGQGLMPIKNDAILMNKLHPNYTATFILKTAHFLAVSSGYSAYISGSRSSHRSGRHRSRRQRAREEEEIYTEIRRPRLEAVAVTEASVEATPVT